MMLLLKKRQSATKIMTEARSTVPTAKTCWGNRINIIPQTCLVDEIPLFDQLLNQAPSSDWVQRRAVVQMAM